MKKIRVVVNGAKGRMGQETVLAVGGADDMELVGECDLGDDLLATIRETGAEAVVDFTVPTSAMDNVLKILETDCAGIIGTTGFKPEQIGEVGKRASNRKRGILIAPNFALGAVLMMHFAEEAAKFMHEAEIMELHHAKKADAPSGTAIKTAELIAKAWRDAGVSVKLPVGAGEAPRGKVVEGICVHSTRLTGFLAHQEVIFGSEGQTLTIRHDTLSRSCFMPGVLMGIREMMKRGGFFYGLETLLFG